jgi:3',5'-cyclic AMP phosphodiesterase CpdA
MRLFAISDLHVSHALNRQVVEAMRPHPDDWLIIAGDVGDTSDQVEWALRLLRDRFRRLVWVPGNHDLWTLPHDPLQLRGEARYRHLVERCRSLGVLTPEDPYPVVETCGVTLVLAPLFLLYDYTFRPDGQDKQEALDRAARLGVLCSDEYFLHPDPYPGRDDWCRERVRATAERLDGVPPEHPLVLVSHFPLRRDLARLPLFPEFALWCGTARTDAWHRRYRAALVVSGHLHTPGSTWRDGTRFEEVSLGYPHEWSRWGGPPEPRQLVPGGVPD